MSKINAGTGKLSSESKQANIEIANSVQTNSDGNIISPNGTGKVIDIEARSTWHYGHEPGFEKRNIENYAQLTDLPQEKVTAMVNTPGVMRIEPAKENQSHEYEEHDKNEAMMNISAYFTSNDPEIASHTYVDYKSGTLTYGEENPVVIATFEPPVINENNILTLETEEEVTEEEVYGVEEIIIEETEDEDFGVEETIIEETEDEDFGVEETIIEETEDEDFGVEETMIEETEDEDFSIEETLSLDDESGEDNSIDSEGIDDGQDVD